MVLPAGNMPSPGGILHAYPPGALANLATPTQSYLLANHHQFGYYPFYPHAYSPYAAQWAAVAAANPYLPPPPIVPQPIPQQNTSASLNDPMRLTDTSTKKDSFQLFIDTKYSMNLVYSTFCCCSSLKQ
jgi:hypothetical protein